MASAAGKSGPGLAKVLQFSFGQKMAADHTPSAPSLTCTSGPTSFLFPSESYDPCIAPITEQHRLRARPERKVLMEGGGWEHKRRRQAGE